MSNFADGWIVVDGAARDVIVTLRQMSQPAFLQSQDGGPLLVFTRTASHESAEVASRASPLLKLLSVSVDGDGETGVDARFWTQGKRQLRLRLPAWPDEEDEAALLEAFQALKKHLPPAYAQRQPKLDLDAGGISIFLSFLRANAFSHQRFDVLERDRQTLTPGEMSHLVYLDEAGQEHPHGGATDDSAGDLSDDELTALINASREREAVVHGTASAEVDGVASAH